MLQACSQLCKRYNFSVSRIFFHFCCESLALKILLFVYVRLNIFRWKDNHFILMIAALSYYIYVECYSSILLYICVYYINMCVCSLYLHIYGFLHRYVFMYVYYRMKQPNTIHYFEELKREIMSNFSPRELRITENVTFLILYYFKKEIFFHIYQFHCILIKMFYL